MPSKKKKKKKGYLQVWCSSPVRRQPLLRQALRKEMADRGTSLAPRKGGGRPPKADEITRRLLLEEDVKESAPQPP